MNEFFSLFVNDADWFVGTLVIGGLFMMCICAILYMMYHDYRSNK